MKIGIPRLIFILHEGKKGARASAPGSLALRRSSRTQLPLTLIQPHRGTHSTNPYVIPSTISYPQQLWEQLSGSGHQACDADTCAEREAHPIPGLQTHQSLQTLPMDYARLGKTLSISIVIHGSGCSGLPPGLGVMFPL